MGHHRNWTNQITRRTKLVTSWNSSPPRQRQKVNDDVLVAAVDGQVQRTPTLAIGQFRIGTVSHL